MLYPTFAFLAANCRHVSHVNSNSYRSGPYLQLENRFCERVEPKTGLASQRQMCSTFLKNGVQRPLIYPPCGPIPLGLFVHLTIIPLPAVVVLQHSLASWRFNGFRVSHRVAKAPPPFPTDHPWSGKDEVFWDSAISGFLLCVGDILIY